MDQSSSRKLDSSRQMHPSSSRKCDAWGKWAQTRFHEANGSKFHRKTYFPKANEPKYLSEKCQVLPTNMFP